MILGNEAFASVGSSGFDMVNESGHAIKGAGTIRASNLTNRATIEAGPTALGGVTPEMLSVVGPVMNEGVLSATGEFTLNLLDSIDQSSSGVIEAQTGGTTIINGSVNDDGNGVGLLSSSACDCCSASPRGCTPPILRIRPGVTVDADSMDAVNGGQIRIQGASSIVLDGDANIVGGSYRGEAGGPPLSASLTAANIILATDLLGLRGELVLEGDSQVHSMGEFRVAPCSGLLRGCTPPILRVADGSKLDIDGSLNIDNSVSLQVTSIQSVTLGGSLLNASLDPTIFDWLDGSLQLDGASVQLIEAAGEDRGATSNGFVDNFAIGTLELSQNVTAQIVDLVDNVTGLTACDEALYVDSLILGPNSTLDAGTCGVIVYYRDLALNGGTILNLGTSVLNIATGDYNDDDQVDIADFGFFFTCMGQAIPDRFCLDRFDADHDSDLDLFDFANFARRFNMP